MNYGILIYNRIFSFLEIFQFFASFVLLEMCLYYWCVLYYELLFLMRLSDSVSFSVYRNIF